MAKNNDITRPPWAVQNGFILFFVAYFLVAALVLALSWKWALGKGWPSYPPVKSIWAWAQWSWKSWSITSSQLAQGHGWLLPGRATVALTALAPLPLACWAGWWAAKPLPAEVHLKGRRLSESIKEARKDLATEFKKRSSPGIHIHPQIQVSEDRETEHMLVLGKPKAGKTQFLTSRMQEAVDRGDKCLVYDNKGDFTRYLLPAAGENPIILAPWDRRCVAWDVASDCPGPADAQSLAGKIIKRPEKGEQQWTDGARAIVTASILHLQSTMGKTWDFADLLRQTSVPYDQLKPVVEKYTPESSQIVESNSKTLQSYRSIVSTATANIRFLARGWEGRPKFSFRRWLLDPKSKEARAKNGGLVIMQGDGSFEELQRAYVSAIVGALSGLVNSPRLPESKTRKLWVWLDEFPQLKEVPEVFPFLEIGRSKGCRTVIGAQNISQLREIYGPHFSESLATMVGTFWLGKTPGVESPKWISDLIGKRKIKKYRISYTKEPGASGAFSGRQDNWEETEEPVIRHEELATTLGPGDDGVTGLLYTCGPTVYRLTWPYVDHQEVRPGVIYAPWTEAPQPAPVITTADQGSEDGGPARILPEHPKTLEKPNSKQELQKRPATVAVLDAEQAATEDPDQKHHEHEETPGEIVAEEAAEEVAEHVIDSVLPGAGAAIVAAEVITKTAEVIHQQPQPATPQIIPTPATEADVWLDDELEEEAI